MRKNMVVNYRIDTETVFAMWVVEHARDIACDTLVRTRTR